ncbi:MAG: CvpA family protein [Ruminococcaceae bacterium]|nr:CvpA family protein [Oscillospiraceae bacterium]
MPVSKKPLGPTPVRVLISLLVTAIVGFLYYYFNLPALNIHDRNMYSFVILLLVVFSVMMLLTSGFRGTGHDYAERVKKNFKIPVVLVAVVVAAILIGSVAGWVVLRANAYSNLISLDTGDFAAEVTEISFDQIPMLDSTSANVLATRKLGELSDLVSQFEVSNVSAQINLNDKPVRVTYLNYGDFFKWFNNQKNGIPAYIVIDMVSQEVTVQRIENGIRYSPSELFFRRIDRYLRFKYPTLMFDDINFEVDEDGQPYWVASVYTKTIGLFGGADVIGAVLVDAVTGESTYYDVGDVPTWVDRVYSAELIMQQYDYHGQYKNGFFNSLFGQRDCTVTTDGYNYIAQDDDVWVYTGVTSVGGDESNVGFILVNQRTKEARYYSCAGAEEYSAMYSAMGAVQQYSYNATFPLLLNISGQPTYFMALKDSSSLVKMYAMVNVQQYQIVATEYTVEACQEKYHQLMVENNILKEEDVAAEPEVTVEFETVTGEVDEIRSAVVDGNTIYYIRLEDSDVYYTISAQTAPAAVILDEGDEITVTFAPAEGEIVAAEGIE